MRILYVLQQSIYDNNGKWKTADSNIQMMKGMLTQVLKINPDWVFYVVIAPIEDFSDIKSYSEIFNHHNVHYVSYKFPIDAFLNRYNFDPIHFFDIIEATEPSIIWNNIVELSRNIKTILVSKKKNNIKLISCNYWMDCPEINEEKVDKSISYDWRQFDGFECSDLCVFTCQSTKEAFIKNSMKKFNKKYVKNIIKKSVIWDFGYLRGEIDGNIYVQYAIPTIVFLNRLSGINYSHHEEFIQSLKKIDEKEDIKYQVIFANPSLKISFEELASKVKKIHLYSSDTLEREKYIKLLWRAKISVHLYTMERYGGCAVREAIEADNIIVCPKVFEYARILGSNYPFYCKKDFSDLHEVIKKALKSNYKLTKDIKNRNRESSFENISIKVVNDIERILR